MSNYKVISHGGNGGNQFDMQVPKTITIKSGTYVDSITINDQRHGGDGGDKSETITLEPGEFVNQMNIRSGEYVDFLELQTNKGQTVKGGSTGGQPSSVTGELIAISGRSGKYLDQIQLLIG